MASLLFVFVHPGDETFCCGGTIARYSRAGHVVSLICATRGSSEPLAKAREKELSGAGQILGIKNIYFLDFVDQRLNNLPPLVIENKVQSVIKLAEPQVLISSDDQGINRHLDQQVMAKITFKVFQDQQGRPGGFLRKLYQVVAPGKVVEKFSPDLVGEGFDNISTVINIENFWYLKEQALLAFASQKHDVDRIFSLKRNDFIPERRKWEFFRRLYPPPLSNTDKEDDFLQGLE